MAAVAVSAAGVLLVVCRRKVENLRERGASRTSDWWGFCVGVVAIGGVFALSHQLVGFIEMMSLFELVADADRQKSCLRQRAIQTDRDRMVFFVRKDSETKEQETNRN